MICMLWKPAMGSEGGSSKWEEWICHIGYKEKHVPAEPRLWLPLNPTTLSPSYRYHTNSSQAMIQAVCHCIVIPFMRGCVFGLLVGFLLFCFCLGF